MKHPDKAAVTVNPTNRCNLRCRYCMAASEQEQASPIEIPIRFARKGIEDALRGYPTGLTPTVLRFFSPGEPTQAMDIVRECVEYARHLSPSLQTELQTNGLFPSREDGEWIADHFDVVWFSLDGWPEVNDAHRPDSNGVGRTREIESTMAMVASKTVVGVRATVVEETLNHQEALVDYYYGQGIRRLAFNPEIGQIMRKDDGATKVTRLNIMDFAYGFARAYKRAEELGVDLLSSLTFNFDEPTAVACRSCVPFPQLNPDGSVSSCDMALYSDTKGELQPFIYGAWDEARGLIDYSAEKIEYLGKRCLENLPKCRGCDIGVYCAGGCAGRVAYQTGDLYGVIPEYCDATKYLGKMIPLGTRRVQITHP